MPPEGPGSTRRTLLIVNPKGGSGKTTLATNLAAWYAARGYATALKDYDSQGSSTHWLAVRPEARRPISGIAAFNLSMRATRSWQLRVPPGVQRVIVDTPAAIDASRIFEFTSSADAILMPVGASAIDIHAAELFLKELLSVAKSEHAEGRIGIIANRVRSNTIAFRKLMAYLDRAAIPVVAVLRDSQNYVRAMEEGLGLHELDPLGVARDLAQWMPLWRWLDQRICEPLPVFSATPATEPALDTLPLLAPPLAIQS